MTNTINISADKKITMATVKSFVKNNMQNLFIKEESTFDGMIDGCRFINEGYSPVKVCDSNLSHTLGVTGAWFVGSSRDYFNYVKDNGFIGINIYNSCGSFIIAVKEA